MSSQEQRENRILAISLISVIIATAVIAIVGFLFLRKPADIIEGQADATSVRISGKLPGRIAEFYVHEGDLVQPGDTLVHIHSSVVDAKMEQAEALQRAAQAQNSLVDAGARQQTIQSAADLVTQAEAAATLAEKTYQRLNNLYNEGVVSEQKRDEAKASYEAAKAGLNAARQQLSIARDGARAQEKEAASAMVGVAHGSVKEVQSVLEDQYLIAPCAGQIDQIYPQPGELVAMGAPIMDLLRIDNKWVTFNVREKYLNKLPLGAEVTLTVPALDMKEIKAKVYYVRDMGSYATWRATKTTGDWDSKTFQIKARPTESLPELRPGMSILYKPE